MVLLERADVHFIFLKGSNSVNAGLRCAQRSHDRNFLSNSGIANGYFIFAWDFATRAVNYETDVAVLHPVQHIRPAFADLEYSRHRRPGGFERCRRSAGGDDPETQRDKLAHDGNDGRLIRILHADKNIARFRQRRRGRPLGFSVSKPKIVVDSHYFAVRLHLRSEGDIPPLVAQKGEDSFFNRKMFGYDLFSEA